MNAKELAELKRQLKKDNPDFFISRIAAAYYSMEDSSPVLKTFSISDFDDLSDAEQTLYLNILKKTLTGKLGRNLTEYRFDPGSPIQEKLHTLNQDELKDEALAKNFMDFFARHTTYLNGYALIVASCQYQVKDIRKMADEDSGSTHRFLLVSVNEVTLTDLGLVYDPENNDFEKKQDTDLQVIQRGLDGLMFPSFTDGGSDVNHIVYSTRTPKKPNEFLIENLLQVEAVPSYDIEADCFRKILTEVAAEDLDFDTVKHIQSNLREYVADAQEDGLPAELSKNQLRNILSDSGVAEEKLMRYNSSYDMNVGEAELRAANILDPDRLNVKMQDISVSVKGDACHKISTRLVDGKRYLMIEIDDGLQVNGVDVSK